MLLLLTLLLLLLLASRPTVATLAAERALVVRSARSLRCCCVCRGTVRLRS